MRREITKRTKRRRVEEDKGVKKKKEKNKEIEKVIRIHWNFKLD